MTDRPDDTGGKIRRRTKASGEIVYDVRFSAGPRGDRQRTTRRGFLRKSEAQAFLHSLGRSRVAPSLQPLSEYLQEWIDHQDDQSRHGEDGALSPTTLASYRGHIKLHISPAIGDILLGDLIPRDIRRMHGTLKAKKLSISSVRRIHATLRVALGDATADGILATNPAREIRIRGGTSPPINTWTPLQLSTFLEHVKEEEPRLLPIYAFYTFTGVRRGEALALRWTNVDLDEGTAEIRENLIEVRGTGLEFRAPKTEASAAQIPLLPELVEILKKHKVTQKAERLRVGEAYINTELVFAHEDGTPIRPGFVTRRFSKLRDSAGLPHLKLHGLRHSFATALHEMDVDVQLISGLMRHASTDITRRLYIHPQDAKKRQGLSALGDAIREARSK